MIKKVTKFLTSGLFAAAVEYGVFTLLYSILDVGVLIANSMSFVCGFIVSFLLNKHWVFRSKGNVSSELMKYTILAVVNLGVSNGIIYLLIDVVDINAQVAKFLTMGVIAVWNYLLFSRIIFGNRGGNGL